MEGAAGEARGVVPRATEQVFSTARELKLLGWSFEFRASCLEIYNEELRDLLPSEGAAKSDKKVRSTHHHGHAPPAPPLPYPAPSVPRPLRTLSPLYPAPTLFCHAPPARPFRTPPLPYPASSVPCLLCILPHPLLPAALVSASTPPQWGR